MRSIVFYGLGLGSGILLSVVYTLANEEAREFWHRIRKTNKPQFSYQTRESAQLVLIRAEAVFNQAINGGGFLTYPWIVRGENVSLDGIQDGLRSAIAAIPKKEFKEALDLVNKEIFEVWHSRSPSASQYITLDSANMPETDSQRRARLRGDKYAELQVEAAERGLPAAEMARKVLDKLSRNV